MWCRPARQASSSVLGLDRIVLPIHQGVHWTCAVVDIQGKAVRYYDSLMGEDAVLARHLLRWVEDESADKLKQRWDTSKWAIEFPKNIPRQRNGCDCGVFAIMFADRLGLGVPFDFDQVVEAIRWT
ncbi:Sentrin-specific protease 1 [Tetrabaena socialis]|uniref:Sentrin-specific protease 1 n=1 Tax=Tetrabaena socialis TaxID=47790 RepID=A0A2J7ZVG8_9CHLO|nr:Sentrin-specific protease 1 [Tetrabaena socialis]|eukprot:PNH04266.1 Sentrin-specific protease 1 [Tetrabaena socialis]